MCVGVIDATLAAGVAGSTRTLDRHLSFPTPLPHLSHPSPHSSLPTTLPYPLLLQLGTAKAAPSGGRLCRRLARADPGQCAGRSAAVHAAGTCTGPAGRVYENTGLQTELKQEQQTESARSSSPVFSSSPAYCFQHCFGKTKSNIV